MRTNENRVTTVESPHDDFDTQLQCEDVYTGEDPDEVAASIPLTKRVICGRCLKHLSVDGSHGPYRLTASLQVICSACCAACDQFANVNGQGVML